MGGVFSIKGENFFSFSFRDVTQLLEEMNNLKDG